MDNYVFVGKIINTFGIKGELKVLSDFEFKERVFTKDFNIYIGEDKIKEVVNTYRHHQEYELITLMCYNNINEVLKYKDNDIYIKRSDLKLEDNEYLLSDLIDLDVYDEDKYIGKVIDYTETKEYYLLKVHLDKNYYIPCISHFIKNVDLKNKRIDTNKGSDLIL